MTTNLDQYKDYIKIINCLIQVIDKNHYLKRKHVSGCQNQSYCWDLVKQTLRWYYRYLEVLDGLLDKPIKNKNRSLLLLLIIGLVRIDHLKESNHHVVKHSVDLARAFNYGWADKLVNKILRRYIAKKTHYDALYKSKPSLMMAHPGWLLKAIKNSWPEEFESIVLSNQSIPNKWLNVSSVNQAQALLLKYQNQLSKSKIIDTALKINNHKVLEEIISENQDWGYIQDLSAQMLAIVLKCLPEKPKKVLDACASPGGKTYILLRDYPDADLTCSDIDNVRLDLLDQNLKRFLPKNKKISIYKKNWCDDTSSMIGSFDLIVLDVPCSGSGIIKRHPEKKFNPWNLKDLCQTQAKILNNVWVNLSIGGYLVYSTCSILKEENSEQVFSFISNKKNIEIITFELPIGFQTSIGWQILPNNEMDGHYFVVLKKLG